MNSAYLPVISLYILRYSAADAVQEKSASMACFLRADHFFLSLNSSIASSIAPRSSWALKLANEKPVPSPVYLLYGLTVSLRPPVSLTIGRVP